MNITSINEAIRGLYGQLLERWSHEESEKRVSLPMIQLGPVVVTVIRGVASFIGGVFIAHLVYIADALFQTGLLTYGYTLLLALLLTAWLWMSDEEPVTVPVNYGTVVTWFGKKTPFWLSEGEYPWIGRKLLFNRFDSEVPSMAKMPEFLPAKNGFVFIGDFVVPIWDDVADKNPKISNIARDSSTVISNLTLVLKVVHLNDWIGTSDPLLEIADRARATYRDSFAFFTGIDCAGVKGVFPSLMMGWTIVSSFIKKQVGSYATWSMIQDNSGKLLYRLVKKGESVDETKRLVDEAKRLFITLDLPNAHSEMKMQILNENKEPVVETRSVNRDENPHLDLPAVLEEIGCELKNASVSNVTFSKIVEDQANAAASETFQQEAQVKSAQALVAAKKILKELEAGGPESELATIIAAAQDNPNINIVYAPGADRLTRAAAVIGANRKGGT